MLTYDEIYHNPFLGERCISPSNICLRLRKDRMDVGDLVLKFNFFNELVICQFLPKNDTGNELTRIGLKMMEKIMQYVNKDNLPTQLDELNDNYISLEYVD